MSDYRAFEAEEKIIHLMLIVFGAFFGLAGLVLIGLATDWRISVGLSLYAISWRMADRLGV